MLADVSRYCITALLALLLPGANAQATCVVSEIPARMPAAWKGRPSNILANTKPSTPARIACFSDTR